MPKCNCCGSDKVEKIYTPCTSIVCTDCGSIVDESTIIDEIEYGDTNTGQRVICSQFVPTDIRELSCQYNKPYQNVLISKAKAAFKKLGSQIRASEFCIESALHYYKEIVKLKLTKGRRNLYIYGACMLIACRFDDKPYNMRDIAKALDIDGISTFQRTVNFVIKELGINLPMDNEYMFILRYANRLNFKDKTQSVVKSALSFLEEIKKNDCSLGKKQAGLYGAALLLAARFHQIPLTLTELSEAVGLSRFTMRKRLIEFLSINSGFLPVENLLKNELTNTQEFTEMLDKPLYHWPAEKWVDKYLDKVVNQSLEQRTSKKNNTNPTDTDSTDDDTFHGHVIDSDDDFLYD